VAPQFGFPSLQDCEDELQLFQHDTLLQHPELLRERETERERPGTLYVFYTY
jgi:hypothetical protein